MKRRKRRGGLKTLRAIEDAMRKRLLDKHGIDLRTPRASPIGEIIEWH